MLLSNPHNNQHNSQNTQFSKIPIQKKQTKTLDFSKIHCAIPGYYFNRYWAIPCSFPIQWCNSMLPTLPNPMVQFHATYIPKGKGHSRLLIPKFTGPFQAPKSKITKPSTKRKLPKRTQQKQNAFTNSLHSFHTFILTCIHIHIPPFQH